MGSQWGYKCRYFPPFKIINSMEARSYRPLLLSFTFLIIITSSNNLIPINFPHSCLSQFVDKVMGKRSFFWDEEAKRRRRKSWTENVLTSTHDVRLMAARAYVWTDMTIMIGPGTMVMRIIKALEEFQRNKPKTPINRRVPAATIWFVLCPSMIYEACQRRECADHEVSGWLWKGEPQ